jgi:hypothetical protein
MVKSKVFSEVVQHLQRLILAQLRKKRAANRLAAAPKASSTATGMP